MASNVRRDRGGAPAANGYRGPFGLALLIVLAAGIFVGAHIVLSALAVRNGGQGTGGASASLILSCLPIFSFLLSVASCSNSLRSSDFKPGPFALGALLALIAIGALSIACRMLDSPAASVSLVALSLLPAVISLLLWSVATFGGRGRS